MKKLLATIFGVAAMFSTQAVMADEIKSYDIQGFLWWHQTQTDGAPTNLTGRVTYNYTTNEFTSADFTVGTFQFSMNSLGADYATRVVYNTVAIDLTTSCLLSKGQTCANGIEGGSMREFTIGPLLVGPNASYSYTHFGTLPFQFEGYLGTPEPTPTGDQLLALYIGSGTVAAVPEPETYAMLLGGLGMLGLIRRRKATRA